ncbi:hypothetical protein GH714_001580 [Hevea brasiliensis]|uniref:phosphoglycerate kinase n=1 Tax=Hevea brasiliensis TaxID=3981 RepID=A0A6A6MA42_HEVBR|nr:hypothetical protein GH714_001580 [Hevea brasiliensis]
MASATAPTTLSLLKTTASSFSNTRLRASLLPVSSTGLRSTSLRRLGFAAADPLFSHHVASKIQSFGSGKASRAVVSMAKKSVGELTATDLKGKKGRPKGVTPKFSLAPLVPRLSELLGIQVVKADDCIGPEVEKLVASLPEGGVLLLEM